MWDGGACVAALEHGLEAVRYEAVFHVPPAVPNEFCHLEWADVSIAGRGRAAVSEEFREVLNGNKAVRV